MKYSLPCFILQLRSILYQKQIIQTTREKERERGGERNDRIIYELQTAFFNNFWIHMSFFFLLPFFVVRWSFITSVDSFNDFLTWVADPVKNDNLLLYRSTISYQIIGNKIIWKLLRLGGGSWLINPRWWYRFTCSRTIRGSAKTGNGTHIFILRYIIGKVSIYYFLFKWIFVQVCKLI